MPCIPLPLQENHPSRKLPRANEYDIERKWREARIYQVAPVSTNLILGFIGQHVLAMPKSY
jgi:alkylation response protein AidB-like acyl-CoA dehydrogenase